LIQRILVVGLGSIGQRHLRLARELFPLADIRVLRHQPCLSMPEFADGCFSDLQEAVGFEPQVAVIANPAPYHLISAQALAGIGTHLLIEKPLSISTEGVPHLMQTCLEQGACLQVGYNLRFLPSLQRFRALLNEYEIGRLLSVRCEVGQFLPGWRPDADYRQGVSARRELGGGALLELSHELDYLSWIFGDVESVKATLSRQSDMQIDVEDTVHLIMSFVPDAEGHRLIAAANIDFIRHDTTRVCTAIGEQGSLRWNGLTGMVEKFEAGGGQWQEVFHHQHQRDDSYLAEWKHFLECIRERKSPLIGGKDGLAVLQIVDAARRSSESGKSVSVAREGI